MFRKTLKLDVGKLKTIVATGDEDDIVWQVTPRNGEESTLTLLTTTKIDGQDAELLGLVAKVPIGYKLFPLRRIVSIAFDTGEAAREELPPPNVEDDKEKKDKEKKKDE